MARKEGRSTPKAMLEQLWSDIRDAQANVRSVIAAREAAEKYPPMARAVR